ncbi:hypothetical protein BHS07_25880 [Myxococcus xanthus]|nr:hypothetical protein BHS07_25880 [Myxococcus xanthus]
MLFSISYVTQRRDDVFEPMSTAVTDVPVRPARMSFRSTLLFFAFASSQMELSENPTDLSPNKSPLLRIWFTRQTSS